MDIVFKPITVADRAQITAFTLQSELQNCDLSFANICSWQFLYGSEYAICGGFLLIRFWIENKKRVAYMRPLGKGDFREAVGWLETDSLRLGHPLCLLGITPITKQLLNDIIPGEFIFIPERDYFDYIYLREDLASLKGKKFQPKRNQVNRFKKQYAYEYLPLTPERVPDCLAFERQWYEANATEKDTAALVAERQSMTFALEHFSELGLKGGILRVGGRIVAFTYGAPINATTFGVHVEKADVNYEGAYAVINQEFASRIPERFTYLNREEDLGIAGLRQAKLSYNPVLLLEKYAAIKKK